MRRLVAALAVLAVVPLVLGAAASPDDGRRVLFSFADPRIAEASALVALTGPDAGRFATTNDSGDRGRVFAVDGDGRTVGVTTWSDDPTDVEALAQCEPGTVWVGDIGDNQGVRSSIQVAEVPIGSGDRTVSPARFDLVYPDGQGHDAETLLCHPGTGRLYVATKEWAGGRLYAVPKRLSTDIPNRLRPLGPVLPMATDGSFFADGQHLIIRGYFTSAVYAWRSLEQVGTVPMPAQQQGEGIAVLPGGGLAVSGEGVGADVLGVRIPADVAAVLAPDRPPSSARDESSERAQSDQADPSESDRAEPERELWPWAVAAGTLTLIAAALFAARHRKSR